MFIRDVYLISILYSFLLIIPFMNLLSNSNLTISMALRKISYQRLTSLIAPNYVVSNLNYYKQVNVIYTYFRKVFDKFDNIFFSVN